MKIVRICLFAALIVSMMTGCQAFFTYSPFSSMQRDISDLSDDEKVTRAEDVLATGDTEDIREAYDAIIEMLESDPDDPELNVLAAELAVGASGITDILSDALTEGDDFDIDAALDSLDADILSDVADHVNIALEGGADVSDETLVIAAATSVLEAVDDGADLSELENWDPESGEPLTSTVQELVDASEFILAMDNPEDVISDITKYFGD